MTASSDLSITLLTSLLTGKSIPVPNVPVTEGAFAQPGTTGALYTSISKLDNDDLTTGIVGGEGVFDKLMVSIVAHLKEEFKANRISGAEYTKAYQVLVAQALQTAASYVMSREQAYWQTVLAQQQAQTAEVQGRQARIELETARVTKVKAQYEAETASVQYAAAKMQVTLLDAQYEGLQKDNLTKQYTIDYMLPIQKSLLEAQTANVVSDRQLKDYQRTDILPAQKNLYVEQKDSYVKDAKIKSAKMWTDVYITMKTMDIAISADQFNGANLDSVLSNLRNAVSI